MEENLLTISAIAQKIGIAESTVRYYRDRFSDFIPSVGEGRFRRYKPEALEILRLIAESLRSGRTAIETQALLEYKYQRVLQVHMESQQSAAAKPQRSIFEMSKISESATTQAEVLIKTKVMLDRLTQSLEKLSTQLEIQNHNNDRLTTAIEKIATHIETQNRSKKQIQRLEAEVKKSKEIQNRHEKEIMWMTREWLSPKKPWWKKFWGHKK
jgi:DNA-binding transcriptional MerR regulator